MLEMEQTVEQLNTVAFSNFGPEYSHKALRENAFPYKGREVSENKFQVIASVDHVKENFFFDHEIDHIPGMLLACIVRQSALVVSHGFYGVDFDTKFMMSHIDMNFRQFGALNEDITVEIEVEPGFRKEKLHKARLNAKLFQGSVEIGSGLMDFRTYDPRALKRLKLDA